VAKFFAVGERTAQVKSLAAIINLALTAECHLIRVYKVGFTPGICAGKAAT
jgi:hypothetical protein